MPTKITAFDVLDEQITEALAELRGARLDYEHCPSTDNERTVAYAERRLDLLFERRKTARIEATINKTMQSNRG